MRETEYKTYLVKQLRKLFPGCVVLENDAAKVQGIPDLLFLYGDRWAMLEVKVSKEASVQPNQEHYVEKLNNMSFAAFIYPENEEAVLYGLQRSFCFEGSTRVS